MKQPCFPPTGTRRLRQPTLTLLVHMHKGCTRDAHRTATGDVPSRFCRDLGGTCVLRARKWLLPVVYLPRIKPPPVVAQSPSTPSPSRVARVGSEDGRFPQQPLRRGAACTRPGGGPCCGRFKANSA